MCNHVFCQGDRGEVGAPGLPGGAGQDGMPGQDGAPGDSGNSGLPVHNFIIIFIVLFRLSLQ